MDRYLEILTEEAHKSHMKHKHSACIIHHNKIISVSHNYQLQHSKGEKYSLHAEESALRQIPKSMLTKPLILCVIRVSQTGDLALSKPCINCMNLIKKYRINKIIYS